MKFDATQESYVSLRNIVSERTNRVVAWVGSGLSAQANLPTWSALKQRIITVFENKANSMEEKDAKHLIQQCREIRSISDYWLSFQRLKSLGDTTYRDTIRELLTSAPTCEIPKVYEYLWKMRISGLLNLNIDHLGTRARQAQTDTYVTQFSGKDIGAHLNVFKSPQPFIVNLHGSYEDYTSWVFTKPELDTLMNSKAYKEFIHTCLISHVVLFIGISVEDEAVGGHLEALKKISPDIGTHYWITNRRDGATDSWAENYGVRLIRYESQKNDHGALDDLFKDILSFKPKEEVALPIEPQHIPDDVEVVDDPIKLSKLESENIRRILNQKAREILHESSENRTLHTQNSSRSMTKRFIELGIRVKKKARIYC